MNVQRVGIAAMRGKLENPRPTLSDRRETRRLRLDAPALDWMKLTVVMDLGAAKPSLFFNQNIPKLALAARLPSQQSR